MHPQTSEIASFSYGNWYKIYQGLYSVLFPVPLVYVYFRYTSPKSYVWVGALLLLVFYYVMLQAWFIKLFVFPLRISFYPDFLELRNLRSKVIKIPLSDIKEVRFRKSRGSEPTRFVADVAVSNNSCRIRIASNVREKPPALAAAFSERGIAVFNDTGWPLQEAR